MTGVEIAAISAFAASAAPYVAAGSAILGAAGSIQSGRAQAAALNYNAATQEANAFAAERDSNAEAARLRDQNRRRLATAANAQGATGADMASGSPLDVFADLAGEARLDEEIIRWRGRSAGSSLRQDAALTRVQASQAKSAGYMRAATSLLGGLGRVRL